MKKTLLARIFRAIRYEFLRKPQPVSHVIIYGFTAVFGPYWRN